MDPSRVSTLADEIGAAYAARRTDLVPPSARVEAFDLTVAYAVERELSRRRHAAGRTTVGLKVGYANKAMWRALKLDTLVWADMYDDTVLRAPLGSATLALGAMASPKIEPEIVFGLRRAVEPGGDAAAVLDAVGWLALGFEIIDCAYANWTFQPSDFVAAYGLHARLVVGAPLAVTPDSITALADALPSFTVTLARNGEVTDRGSGRNSLRSPALCLAELVTALDRRGAQPLGAGSLVSSGTLTESKPVGAGETWTAAVEGLDVAPLSLATV